MSGIPNILPNTNSFQNSSSVVEMPGKVIRTMPYILIACLSTARHDQAGQARTGKEGRNGRFRKLCQLSSL